MVMADGLSVGILTLLSQRKQWLSFLNLSGPFVTRVSIKTLHNIFNRQEKSAFITSVESIYKHGLGLLHVIVTTYIRYQI